MGRLKHESSKGQVTEITEAEQSATDSPEIAAPVAHLTAPAAAPERRGTPVFKWLVWSFAFVITATTSATLGAVLALMTPLSTAIAPTNNDQQFSLGDLWQKGFRYQVARPVNILVLGIDEVPDVPTNSPEAFDGRSDTMLLVQVNPDSQAVNVLSIPRDTQVEIPGAGITKINHANAIGGASLSARVVSRTMSGVSVDRYVRINTAAFRELVDLVGGVEVFVPRRMAYVDYSQDLHIDLEQGWQTLNGDQAEQFARFRNDGQGDIGRVQRQQQLIRALRDRITSPAMLTRLPQAVQLVRKYLDTNLTIEEMLALANFGIDVGQDNFRMVMLPGRFSTPDEYIASYWLMDPNAVSQVMQEFFDISPIGMVSQRRSVNRLRIAVQNASSDPHLGSDVANYLRDQGFSNVYVVRDWPDPQRQTQIIVQRGDLEGASMLETMLGLGHVVAASTGDLESDLTVRVGDDWVGRSGI